MTPDQRETRLAALREQWQRHPERRPEIEAEAARLKAGHADPATAGLDPDTAAAVHLLRTVLGAELVAEVKG